MAIPYLACMMWVTTFNNLPPRLLPTIQAVEGGEVGMVNRNTNGTEDLGVMQVNTVWIKPLARFTGQPEEVVRRRLIEDACFNIAAAGAILRLHLDENPGDTMRAIGNYHSRTPELNLTYQKRLIEKAARLFGQ